MSGKEVDNSEPPAHVEAQGKARLMYGKGNKTGAENSTSQMPRGYFLQLMVAIRNILCNAGKVEHSSLQRLDTQS